jgi:hypothetical protein
MELHMTFKFLKIIGIGFILSVSTLANATLIDNGDYSTDTESGLDWLDWTLTVDKTQAEALIIYGSEGWRTATQTEATNLMVNFFGAIIGSNPAFWADSIPAYAANNALFVGLLGASGGQFTAHATLEGFGLVGVDGAIIYTGHMESFFGAPGFSAGYAGIALVKVADVSEPAIITLFVLGFVGIGFVRGRQS